MRERIECKTHKLAVMVTTVWPMLLGMLAMSAGALVVAPFSVAMIVIGLMALLVITAFCFCVPMYLGSYHFLPATQVRGARIIARLGRSETTIASVYADEIIVKQSWIEKAFGVCHIRQKDTPNYFRGVPEPEKVQAWINDNFPARPAERPAGKKGKSSPNRKK